MKNSFVKLVVVLSLFGIAADAQVESSYTSRLVVYGVGTIETPAERAKLNFSVKGFGSTLEEAVSRARKKVTEVSDTLIARGFPSSSLSTYRFASGDNYEGKAFLSSRRDYRARLELTVTVDSLDKLESLVSALTKGELETLSDISFSLISDSSRKLEAKRRAVENARIKATIMARELGVEVGRVLYVEDLLSGSDGDFYITTMSDVLKLQAGYVREGVATFFSQRFTTKSGVRVVFEVAHREDKK